LEERIAPTGGPFSNGHGKGCNFTHPVHCING
jgi:hypothetical protein